MKYNPVRKVDRGFARTPVAMRVATVETRNSFFRSVQALTTGRHTRYMGPQYPARLNDDRYLQSRRHMRGIAAVDPMGSLGLGRRTRRRRDATPRRRTQ